MWNSLDFKTVVCLFVVVGFCCWLFFFLNQVCCNVLPIFLTKMKLLLLWAGECRSSRRHFRLLYAQVSLRWFGVGNRKCCSVLGSYNRLSGPFIATEVIWLHATLLSNHYEKKFQLKVANKTSTKLIQWMPTLVLLHLGSKAACIRHFLKMVHLDTQNCLSTFFKAAATVPLLSQLGFFCSPHPNFSVLSTAPRATPPAAGVWELTAV